ncbi:2TM domain-containing protein [Aureisphaera galaxeae]|uniref:2TM domain-containing protein n=1 Tax=Aureisphaera galaxeae TaxID=1538023 RepID=UPI00235084DF|nr:2TM domain-containing protein [Aureisphaera galaxeae]MDC8003550.1 2TM domain-containing protein [Aureisphaera galaxeae]
MKFLKEFGKAFSIGVLVFLVIGLIQYLNGNVIEKDRLLKYFVYNQLYSVVLYMVNIYFFQFLWKRYGPRLFTRRIFVRGAFGVSLVTIVALVFLEIVTSILIEGHTLSSFIEHQSVQSYYPGFTISMVITAIFYTVFYYRHKQEHKVKEQKIIAKTASAQFDALKNQLDPHFLFNSLNVLTSLIEENPVAATKFTTSLSKVYRYVLEQKNKELVTVEEELKFAKIYMSLIKMRFEDSIVFTIPENINNPEAKVVPLSLQLLLENAVKHNMVTPSRKLHISIVEENGNLVVRNNVQPKKVVKESSGVGLQNIRQRYYLITDRPVDIKDDGRQFSVAIPLLTQNVSRAKETQDTYISAKKYDRAKKKVEELKGFYIHFGIYCIMVPVFIYLNVISTGFPWALFPIIGWGAGVGGHAMEVFGYNPLLGKNWEERKIKELMDKDR